MIREATRKSKDGRIDMNDFLDHSAASTRYGLFSPMEAQIIFHFAGRGNARQRLSLLDFGQLLEPGWQAPTEVVSPEKVSSARAFASQLLQSAYNFGLGGIAGAFGATMVYPIDLGMFHSFRSGKWLTSLSLSARSQGRLGEARASAKC